MDSSKYIASTVASADCYACGFLEIYSVDGSIHTAATATPLRSTSTAAPFSRRQPGHRNVSSKRSLASRAHRARASGRTLDAPLRAVPVRPRSVRGPPATHSNPRPPAPRERMAPAIRHRGLCALPSWAALRPAGPGFRPRCRPLRGLSACRRPPCRSRPHVSRYVHHRWPRPSRLPPAATPLTRHDRSVRLTLTSQIER